MVGNTEIEELAAQVHKEGPGVVGDITAPFVNLGLKILNDTLASLRQAAFERPLTTILFAMQAGTLPQGHRNILASSASLKVRASPCAALISSKWRSNRKS